MNDFLQSIRGNQKDKRTPKTRRNFDNNNFNTAQNFNTQNFQNQGNYQSPRTGNIKRTPARSPHVNLHGEETQSSSYVQTLEPFDVMLDLLDAFTKNQEMMISVQEKRILAEERKAIALEEIAEYLRVLTMPSFQEKFFLKNGNMPKQELLLPNCEPESSNKVVESDYNGENNYDEIPKTLELEKKNEEITTTKSNILSREEVINIINSMRSQGRTFDEVAQYFISIGQPTFSGKGAWHAQTIHRICAANEKKEALSKLKAIKKENK